MKKQKSIAIINDLSGFGRCSLTVALPILSTMGIQCGVIPTAILSNQTEYPNYTLYDFTKHMPSYIETWKQLHFCFDGLYTGFLGSLEQISVIEKMIKDFSFSQIIIDPVMGDHGQLYDSYTPQMCNAMKELVQHATLITPNITELCILTDHVYREAFAEEEIEEMCSTLCKLDSCDIIVTGIEKGHQIGNAIYANGSFEIIYHEKIEPMRPGTGDVFASIIAGSSLHNTKTKDAVQTASHFIKTCLKTSASMQIPINDGVCFEQHLSLLLPDTK